MAGSDLQMKQVLTLEAEYFQVLVSTVPQTRC